jgi:hypothetical protein
MSSLVSYTKRQYKKVVKLGWDDSEVVFICPVTMKPVEGACFKICLPKQELKTAAFCLKWGIVVIKIALATQGLGGMVPDISTLLPDMDMDAAQKMIEEMTEATGAVGEAVKHVVEGEIEAGKEAVEEEFKSLSDGAIASEMHIRVIYDLIAAGKGQDKKTAFHRHWKPKVNDLEWGMELVAVEGKSVWASKEGAEKLKKDGLKALNRTAKRDLDRQTDTVKVGEDKDTFAKMAMNTVSSAVSSVIQKTGIDIQAEEDEIANELQDKEGVDLEVTKALMSAIYCQDSTALEALATAEAQEVDAAAAVKSVAVKEGGDVLDKRDKCKLGDKPLRGRERTNVTISTAHGKSK